VRWRERWLPFEVFAELLPAKGDFGGRPGPVVVHCCAVVYLRTFLSYSFEEKTSARALVLVDVSRAPGSVWNLIVPL